MWSCCAYYLWAIRDRWKVAAHCLHLFFFVLIILVGYGTLCYHYQYQREVQSRSVSSANIKWTDKNNLFLNLNLITFFLQKILSQIDFLSNSSSPTQANVQSVMHVYFHPNYFGNAIFHVNVVLFIHFRIKPRVIYSFCSNSLHSWNVPAFENSTSIDKIWKTLHI